MNKRVTKIGWIVVAALLCLSLVIVPGCTTPAEQEEEEEEEPTPIVIRYTSTLPPADTMTAMTMELETIIPEATDGRVEFELYPGGQLYGMVDELMAVQSGDVEMCNGGAGLSVICPEWDAISILPFLFDDEAHLLRFMETDAFKALLDRNEAMGFKHIAPASNGGGGYLYNNQHPVETLEDFEGVKYVLPPFPILQSVADSWGMNLVTLSTPEVTTAIETGVCDGTLANRMAMLAWNLKELCPYMTDVSFGQSPYYFCINTDFWNDLPADIQQILESVFTEQAQEIWSVVNQENEQCIADFEADPGTVVSRITGAELDRWREAVQPAYDLAMEDPNVKEIIEAVDSVR